MKRVLIILGHPRKESFCAALAEHYKKGCSSQDVELRELNVVDLDFDLNYDGRSREIEEDLKKAQEDIAWAEHIVLAYPIWWGAMPAVLKGFFDKVLQSGFAFRYEKGKMLWQRLLKGRTARVFITMDTPPWFMKWFIGNPSHKMIKHSILGFSGIKVKITTVGSLVKSSEEQRKQWLLQAEGLGKAVS